MTFIDGKIPNKPKNVKPVRTTDGKYVLFWERPKAKKWNDVVDKFVVYRFAKGEKINLDNPSKIVAITYDTMYELPYRQGNTNYIYVVTALNRLSNESKGVKQKIKL